MSRFDSISPMNSRNRGETIQAYKSRSSTSNPATQSSQSTARTHRLENSDRIKLDKVSISEEARNIDLSPKRESVAQIYNRLEKYRY